MVSKWMYYLGQAKEKGFARQLKEMLYDFYYSRKLKAFDTSNNEAVVLHREIKASEKTLQQSKGKDSHRNAPTPYYYIFEGLNLIPIPQKQICLLDYGCGNGRILVSGMSLGFSKVIGVDLDEEGIRSSFGNCKKAEKKFHETKFEVIRADASDYAIPSEVNVVYIFNSFGGETLKNVIDNICRSYKDSIREIFVVYYYPMFAHLFDANEAFEVYYKSPLKSGYTGLVLYKLSPAK